MGHVMALERTILRMLTYWIGFVSGVLTVLCGRLLLQLVWAKPEGYINMQSKERREMAAGEWDDG